MAGSGQGYFLSGSFPAELAVLLCLAGLALGAFLSRRRFALSLSDIGRGEWIFLAAVLAGHALLVTPLVSRGIWHENHGVSIALSAEARFPGLTALHGPAYAVVMGALRGILPGEPSVFSLNYIVSTASAALFFVLARLLFADAKAGLAAACLLLFSPGRMRLSVSEDMAVLAEFFLILALSLFQLSALEARRPREGGGRSAAGARFFALGLAAVALLAHTRAEMIVLGPVMAACGILFLGPDVLRWARPPRRAVGLILAAGAVCLPRAIELAGIGDPRVGRFDLGNAWGLWGPSGLNTFFDGRYTPAAPQALALAGLGAMSILRPRLSLGLNLLWLVPTLFYASHLNCAAMRVRTALASQFSFALLGAGGFSWLAGRLWKDRRGAWVPNLALMAVLVLGVRPYFEFLERNFLNQEDHLFLSRAAAWLPPGAAVITLAQEDDPGLKQSRFYQNELIAAAAGAPWRKTRFLGIREFLGAEKTAGPGRVYFYHGASCYRLPCAAPGVECSRAPEGYVHPLCREMTERFPLRRLGISSVGGRTNGWDGVPSAGGMIGLFELRGLNLGALAEDKPPAPLVPGVWMRQAFRAKRAGSPRFSRLALWTAMRLSPTRWERGAAAVLYQELGDPAAALAALAPLLSPGDGSLRLFRAELQSELGRRSEALDDLRKVAGADALERRLMAAVYRRLGESAQALAAPPGPGAAPGAWIERAELLLEAGRPGEASRALDRARALEPDEFHRIWTASLDRRIRGLGRLSSALREEALRRLSREIPFHLARAQRLMELGALGEAGDRLWRANGPELLDGVLLESSFAPGDAGAPNPLAAVDILLQVRPGGAELHLRRAELLSDSGRGDLGLASLRRAVSLGLPPDGLRRAVRLYHALNRYDPALRICEGLVRGAAPTAKDFSDKGVCEYLSGDRDEGVADLQRAIELSPAGLQAYLSLGAIHAAEGDAGRALEIFERGLAVKSDGTDLEARRQLVSSREGLLRRSRP